MINKSKKEVSQSTVNALPSPATDQRPWLSELMRSYRFPWPWLIILLVGIASGATITHNLGYQKYYRPEQFLAQLAQTPTADERWLVTTHQSLVQTGEMLGLAVTIRRDYPQLMDSVKFLLIPQTELHSPASTDFLWQQLAQRTQSVDLWLVNYLAAKDLPQCTAAPQPPVGVFGYDYRHFNCPGPNPISATVTAAPTP